MRRKPRLKDQIRLRAICFRGVACGFFSPGRAACSAARIPVDARAARAMGSEGRRQGIRVIVLASRPFPVTSPFSRQGTVSCAVVGHGIETKIGKYDH